MIELVLQLAFQAPFPQLHPVEFGDGETAKVNWQKIIGFITVWRISPVTGLPENVNASNLVLKCLMYAFILVQENIFISEEYEFFIKKTLSNIRSFSDRKTESMAYLYNNQKLKVTVQNQFEKDKMMKKLVMVNRQVKKWNATVFSKTTDKKKLEEETRKELAPKEEIKQKEKIHEVDAHLEEERVGSGISEGPVRGLTTVHIEEAQRQTEESKRRDKEIKKEKERAEMSKPRLIKNLTKEKLNFFWKCITYLTRV